MILTRSCVRYFSASRNVYLITGCLGQLGKTLMGKLSKTGTVIGTDIKPAPAKIGSASFDICDVTDKDTVKRTFEKHRPTHVIHLSAILSGAGEKNPDLALEVNLNGFTNVLEQAKAHGSQIFSPSTIAAFGPDTPATRTPDSTIMRPTTIYGITKVHMELMGEYYNSRYGTDFRSIRLPGVISPEPIHGLGTTDYAVEMFLKAAKGEHYTCYLEPESRLPMVFIDDCIQGIIKLTHAPNQELTQRVYNINALDFSPAELFEAIRSNGKPNFAINYKPDFRQAIADSWPDSLRDSKARKDWKWKPKINTLGKLVERMFKQIV